MVVRVGLAGVCEEGGMGWATEVAVRATEVAARATEVAARATEVAATEVAARARVEGMATVARVFDKPTHAPPLGTWPATSGGCDELHGEAKKGCRRSPASGERRQPKKLLFEKVHHVR